MTASRKAPGPGKRGAEIAQDDVEIRAYARDAGFREERLVAAHASLEIATLGLAVPLSEIYRNTGLA